MPGTAIAPFTPPEAFGPPAPARHDRPGLGDHGDGQVAAGQSPPLALSSTAGLSQSGAGTGSAAWPDIYSPEVTTKPLIEQVCLIYGRLPSGIAEPGYRPLGEDAFKFLLVLLCIWLVFKPARFALSRFWQSLRRVFGATVQTGRTSLVTPTVSQWRALHQDQLQRLEQTDIGLRLDTGLANPRADRPIDPDDQRLIDLRVDAGHPRRRMFRLLPLYVHLGRLDVPSGAVPTAVHIRAYVIQ